MKRGVATLIILGLLTVYFHPLFIFAQDQPIEKIEKQIEERIEKRIESNIKDQVSSTKETIKSGFLDTLRKTGSWIRNNLTQKLVEWWDLRAKPYLLSLWNQLLELMNKEIYL
ncbi:hypothetical protein J7J74_01720 [bacterium]|nr:hypothetical protein [bacterium]